MIACLFTWINCKSFLIFHPKRFIWIFLSLIYVFKLFSPIFDEYIFGLWLFVLDTYIHVAHDYWNVYPIYSIIPKKVSNKNDSKGICEARINYSLIGIEQWFFIRKLDSEKLITYLKEMIHLFHSDLIKWD